MKIRNDKLKNNNQNKIIIKKISIILILKTINHKYNNKNIK